jgi:hypothetical protein
MSNPYTRLKKTPIAKKVLLGVGTAVPLYGMLAITKNFADGTMGVRNFVDEGRKKRELKKQTKLLRIIANAAKDKGRKPDFNDISNIIATPKKDNRPKVLLQPLR